MLQLLNPSRHESIIEIIFTSHIPRYYAALCFAAHQVKLLLTYSHNVDQFNGDKSVTKSPNVPFVALTW